MTERTPEQELLAAWLEAAGADGQDSEHKQREHKKFLRALRTVKAAAWLDGYIAGWLDAQGDTPYETPNPYDEEEGL